MGMAWLRSRESPQHSTRSTKPSAQDPSPDLAAALSLPFAGHRAGNHDGLPADKIRLTLEEEEEEEEERREMLKREK